MHLLPCFLKMKLFYSIIHQVYFRVIDIISVISLLLLLLKIVKLFLECSWVVAYLTVKNVD